MSLTYPPSSDLHIPRPADGAIWDPHTVHTHYFGFSIPEERIGGFTYIRYQPAFNLCGAGVSIHRGTDNHSIMDSAYLDYELTMPWPDVSGSTIKTANGLTVDFLEPGREVLVKYEVPGGRTSFTIRQVAVSPLVARAHVVPGEEHHAPPTGEASGGTEQFMHCSGSLTLAGQDYSIDCFAVRDRSWSQVRSERRSELAAGVWSPMYFGPDLALNLHSYEHPDLDPAWAGSFDIPADKTLHYGYVVRGDEIRKIVEARRNVLEYDPIQFVALHQELDIRDESGEEFHFAGQALSLCPIQSWPNVTTHDLTYEWQDGRGRRSYGVAQEIWSQTYHLAMKERFRPMGIRRPAVSRHGAA